MKPWLSLRGDEAEPDLARLPLVYDLRRIDLAEGLRAAVAIASVLLLGFWVHWAPLEEAGLGALFACTADPGGRGRVRLTWGVAFALAGGATTVLFGWLASAPVWVSAPVAALAVGGLALLRVYGQAAGLFVSMVTITLVIALGLPGDPWERGGGFVLGAFWALALGLVVWRLRPFDPQRRAVARAWQALAALVRDLHDLLRLPGPGAERWEAHARAHRRAVRTAIEAARGVGLETARRRGPAPAARASVIRLEAADQIFGGLIALSDLMEAAPAESQAAARLLRVLRPLCVVLAQAALEGRRVRLARITRAIEMIAMVGHDLPDSAAPAVTCIAQNLRIAANLAAPQGFIPEGERVAEGGWRERVLGPLRASLDLQAPTARHALRAMVVSLPAFVLTGAFPTVYGHWLTITLVMTLQPFTLMTWQRAIERTLGTAGGVVLAAAISLAAPGPLGIALICFPLAIACFALRPAGYGLMVVFLTPLVVLLVELAVPGSSGLEIAGMRALYTLLGAALSVAGGVLLWPSREPARLAAQIDATLRAHAAWAEAGGAAIDPARRAAGRASGELEASLARALAEPGRDPARLEAAMLADAALRRIGGRLSALHLHQAVYGGAALPGDWQGWAAASLRALASASAPPPPLVAADEQLARLGRQMALLGTALHRFAQATAGIGGQRAAG